MENDMDDMDDIHELMNNGEMDDQNDNLIRSEIVGEKFNQHVVFTLNKNQSIIGYLYADPMYTIGPIKIIDMPPLGKKFTTEDNGSVAFGSPFQNTILKMSVKKDKQLYVNMRNILASTDNVVIQRGGIVKSSDGNKGYIWLSAAGTYEDIELQDKEAVAINSGIYLVNTEPPSINDNGNNIVKGPCTLKIQTKNIKKLINTVQGSDKSVTMSSLQNSGNVQQSQQQLEQPTQMAAKPLQQVQSEQNEQPTPKKSWLANFFGMKGGGSLGRLNTNGFPETLFEGGSIRSVLRNI